MIFFQHEDLGPLQIKAETLKAKIKELEGNINRDHQLWIQKQGTLLGLTQDLETSSKNILQLQTEHTCLQQEKIRLQSMCVYVKEQSDALFWVCKIIMNTLAFLLHYMLTT